jgi:hypothetical protein
LFALFCRTLISRAERRASTPAWNGPPACCRSVGSPGGSVGLRSGEHPRHGPCGPPRGNAGGAGAPTGALRRRGRGRGRCAASARTVGSIWLGAWADTPRSRGACRSR